MRTRPALVRRAAVGVVLIAVTTVLAACGNDESPSATGSGTVDLPEDAAHVHGLIVDTAGAVTLGTHGGAFRIQDKKVTRVGDQTIDLMGFSQAGQGRIVASGHPGPGVDLPSPVGLIESRDGGQSWTHLSRGGESDFHALTASGDTVYGYDGTLRVSTDAGRTWTDRGSALAPAVLAAHPTRAATVLATTESGVQRSTDSGQTFTIVSNGLILQTVAWAQDDLVFGVEPSGRIHASPDGGTTWQARGQLPSQPHALGAAGTGTLAAALETGVVLSTDGGATFTTIAKAP